MYNMNIQIINPMINDIVCIDISSNFYCEICCNDFLTEQNNYKCKNCNNRMCDHCYVSWIETKYNNDCVYCRTPLEIDTLNQVNQEITMERLDSQDIEIDPIEERRRESRICISYIFFFGGSYLMGYLITKTNYKFFIIFNFLLGVFINSVVLSIFRLFCVSERINNDNNY